MSLWEFRWTERARSPCRALPTVQSPPRGSQPSPPAPRRLPPQQRPPGCRHAQVTAPGSVIALRPEQSCHVSKTIAGLTMDVRRASVLVGAEPPVPSRGPARSTRRAREKQPNSGRSPEASSPGSHPLHAATSPGLGPESRISPGKEVTAVESTTLSGKGPRCSPPGARGTGWGRRRVDGLQGCGEQGSWPGRGGDTGGCSPQHYSCPWAGGHPESSAARLGMLCPPALEPEAITAVGDSETSSALWVWPEQASVPTRQLSLSSVSTRHEPGRSMPPHSLRTTLGHLFGTVCDPERSCDEAVVFVLMLLKLGSLADGSKKGFPHFPTYGSFFTGARNLFARKSLLLPNEKMVGACRQDQFLWISWWN